MRVFVDRELAEILDGPFVSGTTASTEVVIDPYASYAHVAIQGVLDDAPGPKISCRMRTLIDFLRGDANNNGEVDALSDGLFLLRWGFIDGPAPECDDAADVNDDGEVSALTDALRLLQWGFLEGEPPGDPGPRTCGPDPKTDGIDCATPASVCE